MSLLVLDTSAIAAFARGSVNVGEPITEVHSESGQVVLPVVCLIEAARQVGEDMPRLLVDNPACEVEPVLGDRWVVLAATGSGVGVSGWHGGPGLRTDGRAGRVWAAGSGLRHTGLTCLAPGD